MGRAQESLEQISIAKKLDPLSPSIFNAACWLNYFAGHDDAALSDCHAAFELNPNLAQTHKDAEKVFRQLEDMQKNQFVGSDMLALIYEGLGNRRMAVESLQQAVKEDSTALIWLKVDPRLSSLRTDAWVSAWITSTFEPGH